MTQRRTLMISLLLLLLQFQRVRALPLLVSQSSSSGEMEGKKLARLQGGTTPVMEDGTDLKIQFLSTPFD